MSKFLGVVVGLLCALPMVMNAQEGSSAQVQANAPTNIHWFTEYSEAAAKAKAEKKPLVLFFTGSDWCGWCKKMESEILSNPEFVKTAGGQFVFVMLDYPMNKTLNPATADQNAQLKQKYNITGYPTIVILDSDEKFVAETGYRSGGGKAYADYLMGLTH